MEELVKKMITNEEIKFLQTLSNGEIKLAELIKEDGKVLTGKHAFLLYDTYGFKEGTFKSNKKSQN